MRRNACTHVLARTQNESSSRCPAPRKMWLSGRGRLHGARAVCTVQEESHFEGCWVQRLHDASNAPKSRFSLGLQQHTCALHSLPHRMHGACTLQPLHLEVAPADSSPSLAPKETCNAHEGLQLPHLMTARQRQFLLHRSVVTTTRHSNGPRHQRTQAICVRDIGQVHVK